MTNELNIPITRVTCPPCCLCGKQATVEVTTDDWNNYQAAQGDLNNPKRLAQNAFPEMDADDREMLITGTHPACWDAIMGEEDDD
jgi:hypothetical protein